MKCCLFSIAAHIRSIVWLIAQSVAEQTVYVATTGADNQTCSCGDTPQTPCQTIQYAISCIAETSQVTVQVAAGTYTPPASGIDISGTSVLIRGEAGVVLDCDHYGGHGFVSVGAGFTSVNWLSCAG